MLRTSYHLNSRADGPSSTARKSSRSVSPLSRCDHATNPRFRPMSSQQPEPVQSSDPLQPTVAKLQSDSVSGGTGARPIPRDAAFTKPKKPASISGFRSSVSAASSSASILPGKKSVLPASSLIYQDADVGVDLGSTRRPGGPRFVKPSDVDAPPPPPQSSKEPLSIVQSARTRAEQKKRSMHASDSSPHSTDVTDGSPRKKRKR